MSRRTIEIQRMPMYYCREKVPCSESAFANVVVTTYYDNGSVEKRTIEERCEKHANEWIERERSKKVPT